LDGGRKKDAVAIHQEVAREVQTLLQVVFTGQRKGGTDLEAIESATRASVLRAGTAVLTGVLAKHDAHPPRVDCRGCGAEARYHDHRTKRLFTAVGRVDLERPYYICPQCHQGQSPRDRELDVAGTECSPGLRRMMALVASDSSFEKGREQLEVLAGLKVTSKSIERHAQAIGADIAARDAKDICRAKQLQLPEVCAPAVPVLYIEMDGTGIPVVKAETEGRAGKTEGLPAHTREVKIGCVFTQTHTDKEGRPVRDEASTTYVAAVEPAEPFGLRLYTEAWNRGWTSAKKKVVIADGAVWIWNLADQHFPGAIQIVDLYHARQHLYDLAPPLFANDSRNRKRWIAKCLSLLDKGKIEALVKLLRQIQPQDSELARTMNKEAEYFDRNKERMRYPAFRAQGLFVGSGVIEAGCKTVIGRRLKQSGMFWTVRGANTIIALRCSLLSRRFEDYWESRLLAA
jgi:hypothetical protein